MATVKARYPVVPVTPSGPDALRAGNDSKHDFTDPNGGGGPRHMANRIPPAKRGGYSQHGHKVYNRADMGTARGSAGNPASRSGGVGSFPSESRIPGHGGSPQHRGGLDMAPRGGFTASGQSGSPSYSHASPSPSAGNLSGRSHRLIAGRFNRKAQGAGGGGSDMKGAYGGAPVTANT
jgi:hypothetical protein